MPKALVRCKTWNGFRNNRRVNRFKVNKIRINSQSGNLQKYLGNNLNAYERDIERPKIIKQIILEN